MSPFQWLLENSAGQATAGHRVRFPWAPHLPAQRVGVTALTDCQRENEGETASSPYEPKMPREPAVCRLTADRVEEGRRRERVQCRARRPPGPRPFQAQGSFLRCPSSDPIAFLPDESFKLSGSHSEGRRNERTEVSVCSQRKQLAMTSRVGPAGVSPPGLWLFYIYVTCRADPREVSNPGGSIRLCLRALTSTQSTRRTPHLHTSQSGRKVQVRHLHHARRGPRGWWLCRGQCRSRPCSGREGHQAQDRA